MRQGQRAMSTPERPTKALVSELMLERDRAKYSVQQLTQKLEEANHQRKVAEAGRDDWRNAVQTMDAEARAISDCVKALEQYSSATSQWTFQREPEHREDIRRILDYLAERFDAGRAS
jgi:hypothetical protein